MEETLAFKNDSAIHWPDGGPAYMTSHGHRIELQGASEATLAECAAILGIPRGELT